MKITRELSLLRECANITPFVEFSLNNGKQISVNVKNVNWIEYESVHSTLIHFDVSTVSVVETMPNVEKKLKYAR